MSQNWSHGMDGPRFVPAEGAEDGEAQAGQVDAPDGGADDASEREYYLMDADVRGLGLRVRPSGKRTWVLRVSDRRSGQAKMTIADAAVCDDPETARGMARQRIDELKGSSFEGRRAAEERRAYTMGDLARDWATAAEARLRRHVLPGLEAVPVVDVAAGDVERIIASVMRTTPVAATRMRSTLVSMSRMAERRG